MHSAEMEMDDWMGTALHDLSQPLTALECRLHLALMDAPRVEAVGREQMLRGSIREALVQCDRMMVKMRAMQEKLNERAHAELSGGAVQAGVGR